MTDPAAEEATRVDRLASWDRPVTHVRLVDEARAQALARLDIATVGDLVRHYPFRYVDLSSVVTLADARPGTDVTVVGRVHEITVKRPRPRLSVTEIALVDGTGVLLGVWFNQPFMASRFREGERVAFAGKVTLDYGLKRISNPYVERLGEENAEDAGRILPVHRATEGLSTNWLRRLVLEAVRAYSDIPDPLPASLRARRGLMSCGAALAAIHFPETLEEAERARHRLAYQELLVLQTGLAVRRHTSVDERPGFKHIVGGPLAAATAGAMPFELTDDQRTAVDEILADMASTHPMNRMLLGDVGTGKTAVAAIALATTADSSTQAAMMAPTEVLAQQYALKVGPLLDRAGVSWGLLVGSTPRAERASILAGLADGSVSVALGTHALFQEDVEFARLTLAIVDEQHRFGVSQRLALRAKGPAADLLVMTATPIPRSLALTLYGDLDTSYLRVRPGDPGEAHVTTVVASRSQRRRAYDHVRAEAADGRQTYVICPLVEESEAAQAKAATSEAERLARDVFPELTVDLLHGQMRPADKDRVMTRFRRGELDVLVATTVIEVGVDVANATVMIIEDAERFGLAQLHQLRGRVGRGEHPATVYLFADPKTDEGRRRMKAISSTRDGFELAEQDLLLRGEGELLGQRQHGMPTLRIASIAHDLDLVEIAREDARAIVSSDPKLADPRHVPLRLEVERAMGDALRWVTSG